MPRFNLPVMVLLAAVALVLCQSSAPQATAQRTDNLSRPAGPLVFQPGCDCKDCDCVDCKCPFIPKLLPKVAPKVVDKPKLAPHKSVVVKRCVKNGCFQTCPQYAAPCRSYQQPRCYRPCRPRCGIFGWRCR